MWLPLFIFLCLHRFSFSTELDELPPPPTLPPPSPPDISIPQNADVVITNEGTVFFTQATKSLCSIMRIGDLRNVTMEGIRRLSPFIEKANLMRTVPGAKVLGQTFIILQDSLNNINDVMNTFNIDPNENTNHKKATLGALEKEFEDTHASQVNNVQLVQLPREGRIFKVIGSYIIGGIIIPEIVSYAMEIVTSSSPVTDDFQEEMDEANDDLFYEKNDLQEGFDALDENPVVDYDMDYEEGEEGRDEKKEKMKKDLEKVLKKINEPSRKMADRLLQLTKSYLGASRSISNRWLPDNLLGSEKANARFNRLATEVSVKENLVPIATSKTGLSNYASLNVTMHRKEQVVRSCVNLPFTSPTSGKTKLYHINTLPRRVNGTMMSLNLKKKYLAISPSGSYIALSPVDLQTKCTKKTKENIRTCANSRIYHVGGTSDKNDNGEAKCLRALLLELVDEIVPSCIQFFSANTYESTQQITNNHVAFNVQSRTQVKYDCPHDKNAAPGYVSPSEPILHVPSGCTARTEDTEVAVGHLSKRGPVYLAYSLSDRFPVAYANMTQPLVAIADMEKNFPVISVGVESLTQKMSIQQIISVAISIIVGFGTIIKSWYLFFDTSLGKRFYKALGCSKCTREDIEEQAVGSDVRVEANLKYENEDCPVPLRNKSVRDKIPRPSSIIN